MTGEMDLKTILKTLKPSLLEGEYVFCTRQDLTGVNLHDAVCIFKEEEGITLVLKKEVADLAGFAYTFVASWITLTVHSSLEAVGLTAAFSKALSDHGISCNVIAAYYHDHIFVKKEDAEKAMRVLNKLRKNESS